MTSFWKRLFKPATLAEHESGLRSLMAEASGSPYRSFKTLSEARSVPDGIVILEGDDGGQIYVVVKAAAVQCSEAALKSLLLDLDAREWKDPSMAHVYYESSGTRGGVAGGMGGGRITEAVWVHTRLAELAGPITDVLLGKRERLAVA